MVVSREWWNCEPGRSADSASRARRRPRPSEWRLVLTGSSPRHSARPRRRSRLPRRSSCCTATSTLDSLVRSRCQVVFPCQRESRRHAFLRVLRTET